MPAVGAGDASGGPSTAPAPSGAKTSPDEWAARGGAVLANIDRDLLPADPAAFGGMYVEEVKLDDPDFQPAAAFAWAAGIHLSAIDAAATLDPAYKPKVAAYVDLLKPYWCTLGPVPGYTDVPDATEPRRYYDDNEWIVLNLLEAHAVTGDNRYLDLAKATMTYVLSGEDDKLGGGIYWYEQKKTSKNTCSNGPGVVCALELYKATGDKTYLDAGKRVYAWTQKNLQDRDGLYFDNISLDGTVQKHKWSYNTALMIRAACLMYDVTKDDAYLHEARRVAGAAAAKWFAKEGQVDDTSYFAHLLTEAFLELSARDHDARWANAVRTATEWVYANNHDGEGRYPEKWNIPLGPTDTISHVTLKNQASAARAYLRLAVFEKTGK